MGHIGSLHLDAFVNPVGGFLDPGVGLPTGDTTPPVIKPVLTGTLGGNGWFRSNVGIDWSVSDPESAVSATQGCSTAVVNSDTAGQIFACSATSSGGTTTVSTTVKRDTRAPSVRIEVPDDDLAYRRNQIVKSSYRCSDSLSGIATCAGPVPSGGALDTSSAGRKAFTVTATDTAGNVRTATTYYRVR
jgi:hypothetical protein